MAVPVQTWGTLGTMVPEQREFGQETGDYLEANEVYDLFAHLLRQVVVSRPTNPISFLQDQLRSKPPLAVCLLGPPGINRSKYCQQLEKDHKIKHIKVGQLLRQSPELKDQIEAGKLVDDSIVIGLVKAEIAKASKTGWVLDGYPRTRVQAQALTLRETGFAVDKVILLHTGEGAIRASLAAKAATQGLGAREAEDVVNARLQQYHRHVISLAEFFKNVVRQIEVPSDDGAFDSVMAYVTSCLNVRPHANAPLRSHRICVVGACCAGRTTQSKAIARQYGLVHVDVSTLVRQRQQATGTLTDGVPPEWVSDEELCAVVGQRLNDIDCIRKGWVLDGFPKTAAQAEFLRQSHNWPTRMVHLSMSADAVANRAAERKVDPVTGLAYYTVPQDALVASRMVTADFDEPEKIAARFALHSEHIERVLQTFANVSSTIVGEGEAPLISAAIFKTIDEPLPTELAQDPNSGS